MEPATFTLEEKKIMEYRRIILINLKEWLSDIEDTPVLDFEARNNKELDIQFIENTIWELENNYAD